MRQSIQLSVLLFTISLLSVSCMEQGKEEACDTAASLTSDSNVSAGCDASDTETQEPTEPEQPTTPEEPETPTEPTEPTKPEVPTKPSEPEETDKSSFYSPWNKSDSSIVIDAYEGNSIDWNKMATDSKVVGVIHRSSIGSRVDSLYKSRKATAKARGYLWGAYHLGRRGDTKAQADLFLSLIDGEEDTLMVLDLEDTGSSSFMSISEAVIFMEYVYEKTGRIPVVYANHSTTKTLNSSVRAHPLFQQAKLWYARFKSTVTDYPAGIWPNYFLWQFSSEINCSSTGSCLYNVPGTKYDMDVNVYYGSKSELASEWNNY